MNHLASPSFSGPPEPRLQLPSIAEQYLAVIRDDDELKGFFGSEITPSNTGVRRDTAQIPVSETGGRYRASYKNLSSRFKSGARKRRVFVQQYSQIYFCRLQQLKPRLYARARLIWGARESYPDSSDDLCGEGDGAGSPRISDQSAPAGLQGSAFPLLKSGIKDLDLGVDSVVVGVLYKDMKLKPSVLDSCLRDLEISVPLKGFLSDDDALYLEDESIRIRLCESTTAIRTLNPAEHVTGVIIACRGQRNRAGFFEVSDWTLPGIPSSRRVPSQLDSSECSTLSTIIGTDSKLNCLVSHQQSRLSSPATQSTGQDVSFVGFIAGLNIRSSSAAFESILLVRDFLSGSLGNLDLARQIVRLVVVGDTFASTTPPALMLAPLSSIQPSSTVLQQVDRLVFELALTIPVDLIPGANDPTGISLPQQPLHPALFPEARKLKSFQCVTNPYNFELNGVRFLGMSSASVNNVMAFSSMKSPLETLKYITESQMLCPTSPDTLPCYPFTTEDPFCFADDPNEIPNVLFSGGHDNLEFGYLDSATGRFSEGSSSVRSDNDLLILCIPKFARVPGIVLVNSNDLSVEIVECTTFKRTSSA